MTRRTSALRRYPALGYLACTAALALLLPSGLTVPNSGPPTLAEYAPVPGQGEGQSDTSEVGLPTSAGLGAGGVGEGVGVGSPPPAAEPEAVSGGVGVRRPGSKRCVGSPPRQTEDPLSPPCIAFFEGDNGGATAKGVTDDEVVVVAQLTGGGSRTDSNAGELVDCAEPIDSGEPFFDTACKAFMLFFNDRYQAYGRRVHLYSDHGVSFGDIDERLAPFSYVSFSSASGQPVRAGTMSTGYVGENRSQYRKSAPLMNTFRPDSEDSAAIAASYVCAKMRGLPARYAGDPLLRDDTRRFGFWSQFSTGPAGYETELLRELKSRCDLTPDVVGNGSGDRTAATRMRAEGVTTVILNAATDGPATITRSATAAGFYPEWFVPGSPQQRGPDTNFYARLYDPTQWANAFGVTFDYLRPRYQDQHWYRAYREGCPICPEPSAGSSEISAVPAAYDAFSLLFYGIQAAGPRLTVANLDRGLHAIPPRASRDPAQPAAYFAPGNYSYVKDAAAIWWDPSGQAPGSSSAGCYRLAGGGTRRRAGEWPAADDDFRAVGPCQGDAFPGG